MERFLDTATADIANGISSKVARSRLPVSLWRIAFRKLDLVLSAERLETLRVPPGNKLEALSGNRAGQYSIRINEQYRICFVWTERGASRIEIVDYH